MTNYQWVPNSKPDRPGIWLRENSDGSACTINIYRGHINGYPTGKYCFLMDWPEVKDPPRYRDVTATDVGKMVEIRDHDDAKWEPAKLLAILPVDSFRFIFQFAEHAHNDWDCAHFARILDDGQAKREPREITLYSRNGHIGVVQLDDDCEAILFREVVE